jgi:hypothetical protein
MTESQVFHLKHPPFVATSTRKKKRGVIVFFAQQL